MAATALKKYALSNEDKTDEFQIPEFQHKTGMSATSVHKVQELKTEHKSIAQEIIQAKQNTSRKDEENTRVYNDRQVELAEKVKQLEAKKVHVQKEINNLLLQKNTKLHDDISEGINKISNLRNELQFLFEQNSSDRKKNASLLESQTTDIQAVSSLIKDCHSLMEKEYVEASKLLRPLLEEKISLEKSVVENKLELARIAADAQSFEQSKVRCELELFELNKSIETQQAHFQEISQNLKNHSNDEQFKKKVLFKLQEDIQNLESKKSILEESINKVRETLETYEKDSQHIKMSFSTLNDQYEHKKANLLQSEKDISEIKNRLALLRDQELELMRSCSNYAATLAQVQSEISIYETTRITAAKLQEEALAFFNERREFYSKEVKHLESFHKAEIEVLQTSFEQQKETWNQEFNTYMEARKADLENLLMDKTTAHHATLQVNQDLLLEEIFGVVKKRLARTNFESAQVKAELAKDELEPILQNFFSKTMNTKIKPWHKWQPWMWSTVGCATIILGLCLKIYFI